MIVQYRFSDPRIVTGHFDPRAPLLGRPMLLELRAWGLHYLCAVRVVAVREEERAGASVFGFRYDTVAPHLESGEEWFLLTKRHATGEVRFHIDARRRAGQFPNVWSRAGFALLADRRRRAWHRLAHLRLRWLLESRVLPPSRVEGRLVAEGPSLARPPIRPFMPRTVRTAKGRST
jgi:uncharacterized protein (UPF0548 family)